MAQYGLLYKNLWFKKRFKTLSDDAKILLFYLFSCPHSNSLGLFCLHKYYILADLEWLPERLDKPFGELLRNGWINYDDEAKIMLINDWFDSHNIQNENQFKKILADLSEIPTSPIFETFITQVKLNPAGLPEQYIAPLVEKLAERLSELPENPSLKPLGKPLDKRLPEPLSKPLNKPSGERLPERLGKNITEPVTEPEPVININIINPGEAGNPNARSETKARNGPPSDSGKNKNKKPDPPDRQTASAAWLEMVNAEQRQVWGGVKLSPARVNKLLAAGFETYAALICAIRAGKQAKDPVAYLKAIAGKPKDLEIYRKKAETDIHAPPGARSFGNLLKSVTQSTSSG